MSNLGRPAITGLVYFVLVFCAGVYFTFAAVQGEMGLFRRAEIAADRDKLAAQLAVLQKDVDRMENLTRRLSDRYLDLDLLDERARRILGYARPDEIVIR